MPLVPDLITAEWPDPRKVMAWHLGRLSRDRPSCPMCRKSAEWDVGDVVWMPMGGPSGPNFASGMPMVPMSCRRCAAVQFYPWIPLLKAYRP